MHAQLARRPALIPFVFLKNSKNKTLLEFANRLGVQNIALVHLRDECFELVSHGISLF
jgi:hypothetical protein